MNQILKFTITMLVSLLLCSCAEKEEKINIIFPKELSESQKEIVNMIKPAGSLGIISAKFDENIKSIEFWGEVYKDGELITELNGVRLGITNQVDISINETKPGEWYISTFSGNGITKSTMLIEEEFKADKIITKASGYLNYEVDIIPDEGQILAVYYFSEDGSMEFDESVYSDNEIKNKEQYDFLYIIKAEFSSVEF